MGLKLTRKEIEKLLPVMEAYVNGEQIQIGGGSTLVDIVTPDWSGKEYRIKPKERWINLYRDNVNHHISGGLVWTSEKLARDNVKTLTDTANIITNLVYLKTIQLD